MLKWEDLPVEMKSSEVESHYQLVSKKEGFADFQALSGLGSGLVLLVLTSPSFSYLEHLTRWTARGQ